MMIETFVMRRRIGVKKFALSEATYSQTVES